MKCELIVERESIMSQEELDDNNLFPNYLVPRKPADHEKQGDEWQGFVNDIKVSMKKMIQE